MESDTIETLQNSRRAYHELILSGNKYYDENLMTEDLLALEKVSQNVQTLEIKKIGLTFNTFEKLLLLCLNLKELKMDNLTLIPDIFAVRETLNLSKLKSIIMTNCENEFIKVFLKLPRDTLEIFHYDDNCTEYVEWDNEALTTFFLQQRHIRTVKISHSNFSIQKCLSHLNLIEFKLVCFYNLSDYQKLGLIQLQLLKILTIETFDHFNRYGLVPDFAIYLQLKQLEELCIM